MLLEDKLNATEHWCLLAYIDGFLRPEVLFPAILSSKVNNFTFRSPYLHHSFFALMYQPTANTVRAHHPSILCWMNKNIPSIIYIYIASIFSHTPSSSATPSEACSIHYIKHPSESYNCFAISWDQQWTYTKLKWTTWLSTWKSSYVVFTLNGACVQLFPWRAAGFHAGRRVPQFPSQWNPFQYVVSQPVPTLKS